MKSFRTIAVTISSAIFAVFGLDSSVAQDSQSNSSVGTLLTSRDWVINSGRGDAILKFHTNGTIEVKGKNRPPTKWTWKIKSESKLFIDINYQGGYVELDVPPSKEFTFSGHTKKGTPRTMKPMPTSRPEDHVKRLGMDTYRTWEKVADQPSMSQKAAVEYIDKITELVIHKLGANAPKERLDVVVVVRPEKRAKVWLISSLATPPSREDLIKVLEGVEPFEVRKRPYAFVIYMSVDGAKRTKGFSGPPLPPQWLAAAERGGDSMKLPDDIIDEIWETPTAE